MLSERDFWLTSRQKKEEKPKKTKKKRRDPVISRARGRARSPPRALATLPRDLFAPRPSPLLGSAFPVGLGAGGGYFVSASTPADSLVSSVRRSEFSECFKRIEPYARSRAQQSAQQRVFYTIGFLRLARPRAARSRPATQRTGKSKLATIEHGGPTAIPEPAR